MIDNEPSCISPSLAHEIEDAIMFGKAHDLEAVLDNISDDGLPADLRHGLESLHYFREHYGRQPALNETDRKKITLMDASWAMDLLNKVRARIEAVVKRA